MTNKSKNHKCDECGNRKPDVERVSDPFAAEVNNKNWMRWLCRGCYGARMDKV